MKRIDFNGTQLWQFENFSREDNIRHFVTDRKSVTAPNEFTLSYSSSPDKEEIKSNRRLLAEAMRIAETSLYFPSQVHKVRIVNVTSRTVKEELMETDALITNQPGLCIAVMSADCVPILLYDKKNQAVGAVHSGWRGTVAKILSKTLEEMQRVFGTKGEDVIAGIGPSVCQDSYEVGEEVVNEVNSAFGKDVGLMIPQANNKAKLDLWKANKFQLLDFGVRENAIEVSDLCTVKNNSHFFSARKGDAGRFAAGIMLSPEK
ncbi:peptidoglycan editing factor PgeF [Chryseosolibacter indicus]|uniref:Purine nucleoside phosphorylase n=1 Tax=Chryseosolibacter indicus TaxID=2782351 RepID=A0ABS5VPG2_9BACT|nr:peptidoglycan editing factor PgeF [Chryseosolibacter indicus]MBT1702908.1 peptidoglycan editing factor PgeF [Chryseosolibacter indicus]